MLRADEVCKCLDGRFDSHRNLDSKDQLLSSPKTQESSTAGDCMLWSSPLGPAPNWHRFHDNASLQRPQTSHLLVQFLRVVKGWLLDHASFYTFAKSLLSGSGCLLSCFPLLALSCAWISDCISGNESQKSYVALLLCINTLDLIIVTDSWPDGEPSDEEIGCVWHYLEAACCMPEPLMRFLFLPSSVTS